MMRPRLMDDGIRPELDLHGCTVNEALQLSRQLILESVRRGRDSVRLIHGKSTSAPGRRTIKSALTELIDSGQLTLHVSGTFKSDGHMIVALRRRGSRHASVSGRITLRNLRRP